MFLLSDVFIDLLTSVLPLTEPLKVGEDRASQDGTYVGEFVHQAGEDRSIMGTSQDSIDDAHEEVVISRFDFSLFLGRLANDAY